MISSDRGNQKPIPILNDVFNIYTEKLSTTYIANKKIGNHHILSFLLQNLYYIQLIECPCLFKYR